MKIGVFGLLLSGLFVLQPTANGLAHDGPEFADLAEQLSPAVVNISTVQTLDREDNRGPRALPNLPPGSPFEDFFDEFFGNRRGQNDDDDAPPRRAMSLGSGFFIDPAGYVVTNNHVIREADEITVTTVDGEQYDAEIVGRDTEQDLALLKIEGDDPFPALQFGDSDHLRVGDWVLAIGNPFGLGGSVTAGIVSGLQRNINAGNFDYFIQTDASINRGNSGGPMFNMDGEIVGVNTMIFSPNGGNIGIGFAIPANDVKHIVDQLREFGRARRGWIGVTIQGVTDEVAESLGLEEARGAIVSSIVPGGPSDEAGIEIGDIIMEFNEQEVTSSAELPRIVSSVGVDESVKVLVLRDGDELTFDLTTGERPPPEQQVAIDTGGQPQPGSLSSSRILGMDLAPASSGLREQFDIPEDVDGVVIADMSRSSEAAIRGLRPGDVIVQVNRQDVISPEQIETLIEEAREADRSAVLLRVYRDGSNFFLPLPLGDNG